MRLQLSAAVATRGLDVDLEVAPGQTLAVVGPNGAGKSSLLGVAAGLLRPDRARVIVGDRVLTACGPGRTHVPPHARGIGLLAQDPLLFPHLRVVDNVAFGPRCVGHGRRESRRMAQRQLEALDVADLADRRPHQLSGGQAQRVAVARALAADPAVLLLDEPLAALDVDVAPTVRHLLRRVLADRTAVLVTHEVLDAALLADHLVVLEGGRVVEAGPTAEVLARPRSGFGARFAGLNLVRGRWHRGRLVTPDGHEVQARPGSRVPEGAAAVAVFPPSAVAVHRRAVGGSPRNVFELTLTSVEPYGDLVRLRAGDLRADVTAAAAASLGLSPGLPVALSVKATEVTAHAV